MSTAVYSSTKILSFLSNSYFFFYIFSYTLFFSFFFFFFNDTATTEIYTLSLHDALPIGRSPTSSSASWPTCAPGASTASWRSEEHTSELQSRGHLVCRLLLEKKKKKTNKINKNNDKKQVNYRLQKT